MVHLFFMVVFMVELKSRCTCCTTCNPVLSCLTHVFRGQAVTHSCNSTMKLQNYTSWLTYNQKWRSSKRKNLSQYDLGGGLCSDWYSLRSSFTTNGLVFECKNRVSEIKSDHHENILFSGRNFLMALLLNLLLMLLEAFFFSKTLTVILWILLYQLRKLDNLRFSIIITLWGPHS